MNNFLLSVFFGLIFEVEILAMYLAWHAVRQSKFRGRIMQFLFMFMVYRVAFSMSCEAILHLGVSNEPLVRTILLVPIIISMATSAVISRTEKQKKYRRFYLN